MKAREFTINIPINIKINGDGEPEIETNQQGSTELDQNPVMVSPLQQELELKKAELGKQSPVIDKLIADNNIGKEPEPVAPSSAIDQALLDRIKLLTTKLNQLRSL